MLRAPSKKSKTEKDRNKAKSKPSEKSGDPDASTDDTLNVKTRNKKVEDDTNTKTKTKKVSLQPKKTSKASKNNGGATSTTCALPREVKDAYVSFVKEACKTGIKGLLDEFNELKRQTQPIGIIPKIAFDAFPAKNRYKDVFCVDESRVVLKWPEGGADYIHANWAPIDENRKYICTQGPIVGTIEDFWRMVFQEKCKSILMLCNITEQGKKKCEQYWPENQGEAVYGPVTVKVTKVREWMKFMTRTTLSVSDGSQQSFSVEHIQWNDWPDRGVPNDVTTCIALIQLLSKTTPTVIHCSAGIGRTGTIVGLEMALMKLRAGVKTSLREVVRELRARRHGSVQMDIQYLYMHRVLLTEAVNQKAVCEDDIADFATQYTALCKQRGFL